MSGSPYADLDRPPLRAAALRRALLGPGSPLRELQILPETGSTNADLAAAAGDGAPEGTVLVAEHQTAGRGRLDRSWQAPARSALTFSVLLRPPVPERRWSWLPLLTGCAVAEGVRRVTGVPADLKWPNDVLVAERKLAGILVERVGTPAGPAAVLGIGLNVSATAEELAELGPRATSLVLAGVDTVDRDTLLRELLRVLCRLYEAWQDAAGDPAAGLADSYRSRCTTLGRRVRVRTASGAGVEGRAVDVDGYGRLVVATDGGERRLDAGDVVHVR